MKQSVHHLLACVAASMFSALCGPHVGGIVVEQWTPLAEGAWSLEPGAENPGWCAKIVVAEETFISALRPIAAPGTHHIWLNLASSDDDDCAAVRLGPETIYAAGPGTGEIRMPSGVAMRLRQGQALRLNLHVYNSTWQPLEGVSGIEVVRAKPEAVKEEAGFVLAGPERFSLPPKQRTTITQTCGFTSKQTVFALIPLMHQLGVAFKTTVLRGAESTVLYDGAFQFEEQSQLTLGALAVNAGDAITIECTYENPKYIYVTQGHDGGEICYGALLRSPSEAAVECTEPDAPSESVGDPTRPAMPGR